jgi:hypothetical protein
MKLNGPLDNGTFIMFKTAGKKRMSDLHLLDEWRNEANE